MKINTSANFELHVCLFTEEEEECWRNRGFSNFTYVIVAVYFITFESVTVYRNTRRPCYVSKRAYRCHVREF